MMNKKKMELYLHIPFCVRKCAYCDFLSFSSGRQEREAYSRRLIEEIQYQSAGFREYEVCTIFIGGGTPSVLEEEWMAVILKEVHQSFSVLETAEITMEANPGTLSQSQLHLYRSLGVNRISLGLQSADDEELKRLGRIHSFDVFLKTYQRVLMAGFTNINVDLMSALPGQGLDSWRNTLKKVTMLKPRHISAYSLILEPGTPFYETYGGGGKEAFLLPDEEEEREMYEMTVSFLKSQGYERYEISNYAKPGCECRHNVGYWTGVPYLGLGLGAASYINGFRFHNETEFNTYLTSALGPELLFKDKEAIGIKAMMEECMFLGLRLMKGVSQQNFAMRTGYSVWDVYGEVIKKLEGQGLLKSDGGLIRLSGRGIDISNYVMSQFLLDEVPVKRP